jgi:hypothetical protein
MHVLSLPKIGDQSQGWSIHGKIKGFDTWLDVILVRAQRAIGYIFVSVVSEPSRQEVDLVSRAVARA